MMLCFDVESVATPCGAGAVHSISLLKTTEFGESGAAVVFGGATAEARHQLATDNI